MRASSQPLSAARRVCASRLPQHNARASACPRAWLQYSRGVQSRTFLRPERPSSRAVENLNLNRMHEESYDYHVRRRNFFLCGALAGVGAFCYTAYLLYLQLQKPKKFDSSAPQPGKLDPFNTEAGSKRKTVIHDADGQEIVPTGHKVVPSFPRLLDLDVGAEHGQEKVNGVEYTLVGLGIRTVSFLSIEVYLVGYYIATQDIAAIQARLIKEINPIATTLVPSEKEELRNALLNPERSEKLWTEIFREVRPRSVFRITPVRDSDFNHMRDAFVRAITTRTQAKNAVDDFSDEAFGMHMKDFRALFNLGKLPKKSEMLLCRDAAGTLTITFDSAKKSSSEEEKAGGREVVGHLEEERISRLLFLNYLAGARVASEPARKNIVDGIMEFVERPIGTVATQVV